MTFDLNVSEHLLKHLNAQARAEAKTKIETYASDLLEEASRLETASSANNAEPQITSSMVADADLLLRRGYRRARQTKLVLAGKIGAPTGALLAGFFTDAEKLKDPLMLFLFVVLIIFTVTATVLIVVKE
jgi:hypothetical protein